MSIAPRGSELRSHPNEKPEKELLCRQANILTRVISIRHNLQQINEKLQGCEGKPLMVFAWAEHDAVRHCAPSEDNTEIGVRTTQYLGILRGMVREEDAEPLYPIIFPTNNYWSDKSGAWHSYKGNIAVSANNLLALDSTPMPLRHGPRASMRAGLHMLLGEEVTQYCLESGLRVEYKNMLMRG